MPQGSVSVHALEAGYLTLRDKFFVTPIEDQDAQTQVPSLSFLVQHQDQISSRITRIVFDLGIRPILSNYPERVYRRILTGGPVSGEPDVVHSLSLGGLTPREIDFVIFSHVHWDHVGTPADFSQSHHVIGPGAGDLLSGKQTIEKGHHNVFEENLLDPKRTIELSDPDQPATCITDHSYLTAMKLA